ncbi:transcriptional repressor RcnR [Escherichia coli]|nr:transcriptional repressor RcnR [Escherichia coli]
MSHTIRDKQKLKARASKIQGQVVALKKMLDEPHECAAVLQQIAAIRGAVSAASGFQRFGRWWKLAHIRSQLS